MVYHDRRGDLDCWELCLEELCQAFAQDKAMRTPGRAAVVSMVLGAWVDAATGIGAEGYRAVEGSTWLQSGQYLIFFSGAWHGIWHVIQHGT